MRGVKRPARSLRRGESRADFWLGFFVAKNAPQNDGGATGAGVQRRRHLTQILARDDRRFCGVLTGENANFAG